MGALAAMPAPPSLMRADIGRGAVAIMHKCAQCRHSVWQSRTGGEQTGHVRTAGSVAAPFVDQQLCRRRRRAGCAAARGQDPCPARTGRAHGEQVGQDKRQVTMPAHLLALKRHGRPGGATDRTKACGQGPRPRGQAECAAKWIGRLNGAGRHASAPFRPSTAMRAKSARRTTRKWAGKALVRAGRPSAPRNGSDDLMTPAAMPAFLFVRQPLCGPDRRDGLRESLRARRSPSRAGQRRRQMDRTT